MNWDWGRIAQFVDGEGCVTIGRSFRNSKPYYTVMLFISQKSANVLLLLQKLIGGNISGSNLYLVNKNAVDVMLMIEPYMITNKRNQIVTACLAYDIMRRRKKRGGMYTKDELKMLEILHREIKEEKQGEIIWDISKCRSLWENSKRHHATSAGIQ